MLKNASSYVPQILVPSRRGSVADPLPSLGEFLTLFPDEISCQRYLLSPGQGLLPKCLSCGSENLVRKCVSTLRCRACRHEISPRTGTYFQWSKVPLRLWFVLVYLTCSGPLPPSGATLERLLGLNTRTRHSLVGRLRQFMANQTKTETLGGQGKIVEVDETLLSLRCDGEVLRLTVFGMQDAHHIRTFIVPNRSAATLVPLIRTHVASGSIIYSDQWKGYSPLSLAGYTHLRCDHSKGFFVAENGANTWRIDGYWGSLQRFLRRSARCSGELEFRHAIAQHAFLHNHRHDRRRLIEDVCRGRPLKW